MVGCEDRLSELPDDMLHLVLRRLDTRSALATATLSRRWAHLPHELPALEFKVRDILPGRYHRLLCRHLDTTNRQGKLCYVKKLDGLDLDLVLGRYERHGMRSLAQSLSGFLDADDADTRRHVHGVSLEIYPTHNSGSLNRLVATAVSRWGVEDLEVVVLNPNGRHTGSYIFPHHCFVDSNFPRGSVKLKTLKLSNCAPLAPRPGREHELPRAFSALTMLILQDMPRMTRGLVYGSIIRACPALEVLHLKSCGCRGRFFTVDAPDSRIKEMIVELSGRILGKIDLRALPRLERLACMGAPLELKLGVVPRLAHLNLTYDEDANARTLLFKLMGVRNLYLLSSFLSRLAALEDLVLRFTGPEMWVLRPLDDMPPLAKLRRLLVADIPPSWDITWARYLLEAAPFLETLHVHVAGNDYVGSVASKPIWWPPASKFRHRRLGQVVIGGFEATPRQMHFVRFLRGACTALREVVLLRHGVVRENGPWDWEKVEPRQEWQWNDEDRGAVLREIDSATCAAACSTTQIVFG
ncbi:hypothetical protein ACQ4PT_007325 [Festuca glaucescens]